MFSAISNCYFISYCIEPAVSELLVGFHIVSLSPFVPCLEEKQSVFRLFVFNNFEGLSYGFLKSLWTAVYQVFCFRPSPRRPVPLRE